MYLATLTREGEPVAAGFGPVADSDGALSISGGAVEFGLFMIRSHVEETELDLQNAEGDTLRLRLPPEAIGLTADAYAENLRLEVIPV